ncbi:FadR/GntR family transcriptional regulator [Mesorhizobium sp. ES1-1]|uniref:FadR/GntR family transcriptional regulator n=1 Tax=Mesorhizobium sp. ES1-1 TaxID=2876629 RepID=UPI001CD00493|nr:FCD domain-containing protein [Mesorhizobium sp. ES1-1]MBZ9677885.1 GntR family transcriptional regulator [Mesorhizobium sp. ES1-1]
MLDLQPIVKETSAQQVANQMLSMIRRGVWKAGDQLPAERELLAKLSVGRSTVREALQILSTLNVVQAIQGQGTFIKAPRPDEIFRPDLVSFLINDAAIFDLLETRKMLEPQTVTLACLRATDAELHAISRLLDQHAHALESGLSVKEPARLFHVMLAEASHNTVSASFMRSILDLLQDRRRPDMPMDLLRTELRDHREILNLVMSRNAQGAADRLVQHIVQSAVIDLPDFDAADRAASASSEN